MFPIHSPLLIFPWQLILELRIYLCHSPERFKAVVPLKHLLNLDHPFLSAVALTVTFHSSEILVWFGSFLCPRWGNSLRVRRVLRQQRWDGHQGQRHRQGCLQEKEEQKAQRWAHLPLWGSCCTSCLGDLQDGHGALLGHSGIYMCAHRNAEGLVTCKSAGTRSQELHLHKGRAWGLKSEPESSLCLANAPQPWKTNTAIPELCNFATGSVASLNAAGLLWGWSAAVHDAVVGKTQALFSVFPKLWFLTNGFKGPFFQGSAFGPSDTIIH